MSANDLTASVPAYKTLRPSAIGGGANAGYALIQDTDYSGKWGQVDSDGIAAGAIDEAHLSFSVTTDTELGAALQVALQDPVDSADVSFTGSSGIDSLDVEGALYELDNKKTNIGRVQSAIVSEDQDSADVTYSGTVQAIDVEGAINTLDRSKTSVGVTQGMIVAEDTDAQDVTYSGTVNATDVEGAVNTLQSTKTDTSTVNGLIIQREQDSMDVLWTGGQYISGNDVETALLDIDSKMAGMYSACMYAANSGAPTNTNTAAFQKVGSGGGTLTWTSAWDYRPTGAAAQVDTATNKRIDIRRAGLYLVTATVAFDALIDGSYIGASAYITGAQGPTEQIKVGGAAVARVRASEVVQLAVGDYVELYAFQSDSATEAYGVGNQYNNRLSVTLIRPT